MTLLDEITALMDGTEKSLTQEMGSKISMLDGEIGENIYILILEYYVKNNRINKELLTEGRDIPYGGKAITKTGKGLNFKINQIPEELQKIIYRYMKSISNDL